MKGSNPLKGEARAALMACRIAEFFAGARPTVEGDCSALINQVREWNQIPNWEIEGEVTTIRNLLVEHEDWSFVWIPREANFAAHNLAKWSSSQSLFGELRVDSLPSIVTDCDLVALEGISVQ